MSRHSELASKRQTVAAVRARKGNTPLVCLTAHSSPIAALLDAHCDIVLVGDSLGMVAHGLPDTISVTLDMMVAHGRAVARACSHAMVVIDMPFGSYEASAAIAYENAVMLLKETGASAVKVEAGPTIPQTIEYLVCRGVPVMGHVGLRPQASLEVGGFKAKGRSPDERALILAQARAVEEAGAFAVVVEGVAKSLAEEITQSLAIPTIGIGASPQCDGQILVTDDMLGLFERTPKFVRRYAEISGIIAAAIDHFACDVRSRAFPSPSECYFAADATSDSPLKSLEPASLRVEG